MKYLILCAYLCFWRCYGELFIRITLFSRPWDTLTYISQNLLDYNYIKQYGWGQILDQIPEDEEFWIAAKANATFTPFLSWEGCARWMRRPNCSSEVRIGGSLADCIESCSPTSQYQGFLLLQDEMCRCVDKSRAEACFERTNTNNCKTMCLNNPNDRCGGSGSFTSVYRIDQFQNITINRDERKTNCVYEMAKGGSINLARLKSCYDEYVIRRYICNGYVIDHGSFLTWSQAFEECGNRGAQLGFEHSDGDVVRGSYYWTSLRRSFRIDWIPKIDGTKQPCVTVKKDRYHQLIVQMEECRRPHRYLYLSQDQASNSMEKEDLGAYDLGDLIGGIVGSFLAGILISLGMAFLKQRYRICNTSRLNQSAEENLQITFQKREHFEVIPEEEVNNETNQGADVQETGLSVVPYEDLSRGNEEKRNYQSLDKPDQEYYVLPD